MKILNQILLILFTTSIGLFTSSDVMAQVVPPPIPLPNPIPNNTEPIPLPTVNESNINPELIPVPVIPEDELPSIDEVNIETDVDEFVWAKSITMITVIMGVIIAGIVVVIYKKSYIKKSN